MNHPWLEHAKTVLLQEGVMNLSDAEIERCMANRCGVVGLTLCAKEARDAGFLTMDNVDILPQTKEVEFWPFPHLTAP